MIGPLKLRIKMPGDPTKELPITAFIDVKRGGITKEDLQILSQEIYRYGAHLILILTDSSPYPEVLEELEFLPQIVLVVAELRDLIKLLVISFAQKRGIDVDNSLLSRAYRMIFEKFGLKEQIEKWTERMAKMGYLLYFEGFSSDTVKACRFFINSIGKDLALDECWNLSWNIRNFLPFGIDSKIIPDMGLEPLKKYAKILVDYGFLKEEQGKYKILKHPSEERVVEFLEYYGGSTTKTTLMKHFIFRGAAEHMFSSLLEHMERKLLIARESREMVCFLKLPEVKKLREESVKKFEHKKSILRSSYPFIHILTWKEREWAIISLERMEKTIEKFLSEISTTIDEDIIRSYTFLVRELIDWYGYFVDKISNSKLNASNVITQLEMEIGDLERKSKEMFDNLIRAIRATKLQIELQELQSIKDELNEVKNFLENPLSSEDVEKLIKPIAGDKKSRDVVRRDKLITDIDEKLRAQGIRGDWCVPEYVLIKKKEEEVIDKIKNLNTILKSLEKLSRDLILITEEISKLFKNEVAEVYQFKFTSILKGVLKRIAEGVIRRSPFLINISVVTITDLHQVLNDHVSFLQKERERAERANEKLKSLQKIEEGFSYNLRRIESLEVLYRKFWEEDIPNDLRNKKEEILRRYDENFEEFRENIDNFREFPIVEKESEAVKQDIERLNKEAERLVRSYEELFERIKRYINTSSLTITRLQNNVVPKLIKSDKNKIDEILNELQTLYENLLTWVEDTIKRVLEENISPLDIPKTRTTFHEEERNLREAFIKEIKDLDKESTLILMEIIRVLAQHKTQWLSITEVCEMVTKQTNKDIELIRKILIEIAEKGFLTLGIGF
jgi:hypothetical protein